MQLILQRELRREARRLRAGAVRFTCSVIGFVAALFLLLSSTGGAGDGRRVFDTLTFLGFVFCIIAGIRVAAGAIADEKRDGTLPLLILTGLQPSEIVIGKFFAVAIPLIQPLLAFIPALAITVLHGGVTGTEVLRAIVVIASSLILSIATGLCVSSFSRRNEHAGRSTFILLAGLLWAPLLLAHGSFGFVRFFSPWTAFRAIADEYNRIHPYEFAIAPLVLQYSALCLLIAAAFFFGRRWVCLADTV
jgi:ABC-type transport system involved in multi-copper enzyme maturation permease subunit